MPFNAHEILALVYAQQEPEESAAFIVGNTITIPSYDNGLLILPKTTITILPLEIHVRDSKNKNKKFTNVQAAVDFAMQV